MPERSVVLRAADGYGDRLAVDGRHVYAETADRGVVVDQVTRRSRRIHRARSRRTDGQAMEAAGGYLYIQTAERSRTYLDTRVIRLGPLRRTPVTVARGRYRERRGTRGTLVLLRDADAEGGVLVETIRRTRPRRGRSYDDLSFARHDGRGRRDLARRRTRDDLVSARVEEGIIRAGLEGNHLVFNDHRRRVTLKDLRTGAMTRPRPPPSRLRRDRLTYFVLYADVDAAGRVLRSDFGVWREDFMSRTALVPESGDLDGGLVLSDVLGDGVRPFGSFCGGGIVERVSVSLGVAAATVLRDSLGGAPRLLEGTPAVVSSCHEGKLALSAGGGRVDVYAVP